MNIETGNHLAARDGRQTAERTQQRPSVTPAVDIFENSDEILVVADVPGASADGINVRLEKDELTLYARREEDKARANLGGSRTSDYSRTFLVPRGIDAEKIQADLKQGVLTIHLPKSAAVKPRQIQVRAT